MCDTHGGLASDEIRAAFAAHRRPSLPDDVHIAAGARMAREQPQLHFLYREIDALNTPRSRDELDALLRAAGAPSPADVAALRMPVLFIAGTEDPLIPPSVFEVAARYFEHACLQRFEAAGHSVYFERPAAFNEAVERFLDG
jgi:pimeloyl-ACP methyl ester carboxylesterase